MSNETARGPSVAVTGATGFVGRAVLRSLAETGAHIVTIGRRDPLIDDVSHVRCDLLQAAPTSAELRRGGADVLVHLAWNVDHDRYWEAGSNETWVGASRRLIDSFVDAGGSHVVVAGTCAERALELRSTAYAQAKLRLHEHLDRRADVGYAWLRLFFPTGAYEHPDRLIPALIRAGITGKPFHVRSPGLVRDFFDVADAGTAFAHAALHRSRGLIEVGSGSGHSIRDVAHLVSTHVEGLRDLTFGEESPSEPLIADVGATPSRTAWRPSVSLDQSIANSVEWWVGQLARDVSDPHSQAGRSY